MKSSFRPCRTATYPGDIAYIRARIRCLVSFLPEFYRFSNLGRAGKALQGHQFREVLINVRGVELIAREFSQFQTGGMVGQTDSAGIMNYITRDEFSARIEIIETRIDARIESMSAKIDGFLIEQAERDRARLEQECIQENVRLEQEKARQEDWRKDEKARQEDWLKEEKVRQDDWLKRDKAQEKVRLARERHLEEIRQEREKARLEREEESRKAWQEREKSQEKLRLEQEKAHLERDARYASMAARSDRAMERLDESMRMVSTIKANYWAATTVHFLGMVAILVGSYYANQSNVLVTMQTTLAMVQSVKEAGNTVPAVSTTLSAE
ncbi:hypothetical protein DXT77_09225 [Pseudomonas sp. 91RF]|nr:hypothetical protein DXT77_09225 [Pseudomonas sp. 91RF]